MALEYYVSHFKASDDLAQPQAILALGAICADTEAQALHLLSSARLFRNRIRRGEVGPIPTPEEAIAELGSAAERPTAADAEWPRYIAGDPEQVRTQLVDMASVLHVDELMIVTIVHDHRARMRSYELLAQAFELRPRT
jgi:alkanesulfonate monooxygenase SsuD/methylene tetrahydromethanopterin reductase-like flavin-dependent oxidoreductase (luciferase family)